MPTGINFLEIEKGGDYVRNNYRYLIGFMVDRISRRTNVGRFFTPFVSYRFSSLCNSTFDRQKSCLTCNLTSNNLGKTKFSTELTSYS